MNTDKSERLDCHIHGVAVEVFEWQSEPYNALDERGRVGPEMRNGLLRLQCDHGLEGQCFVGGNGQAPEIWINQIDLVFGHAVQGTAIQDRGALWSRLSKLTGHSPSMLPGWAATDIALWDLTGKHLRVPVVDLLGRARQTVPAYATHPPVHPGIDELIRDVVALKSEGFGAYKLHPGSTPVADVIEGVGELRAAVGNGFDLILDPGNRYTFEQALQVGRALDNSSFLWLEDPLPIRAEAQAFDLAARIDTPVAYSDAASFDLSRMARFVGTGHFSVLRGSSRWLGITGLKKACSLMEAHGGFCEVGLGGNPSMNAANLHVMQSVSNARLYEHWLPSARHEFGTSNSLCPTNGFISVPHGPGLGIELDEAWLSDHRVDAHRL